MIATPVETVARGRGDLARLRDLVVEHEVLEVVVGLPRSLSGGEGPAAAKVRVFADTLVGAVAGTGRDGAAVRRAAQHGVGRGGPAEQGRKGKKRRAVVDQAAAVVILQNALDTERATGRPPGEDVAAPAQGPTRDPASDQGES